MSWESRVGFPDAWEARKKTLLERDSSCDQVINIIERQDGKTRVFWQDQPSSLAVWTPGRPVLLGGMTEDSAKRLAESLIDEPIIGVSGYQPAATSFVKTWTLKHSSQKMEIDKTLIFHDLPEVFAARPCRGHAQRATPADLDIVEAWLAAFIEEIDEGGPPLSRAALLTRIERQTLWLWTVDGRPTALAGQSWIGSYASRIGPVYTPPEERGKGYASGLVHHLAQRGFSKGRCTLFTDAANPTSNKIYQALGFRPSAQFQLWRFVP